MPPKRPANQIPNASKRLRLAGRNIDSVKKSGARKGVEHDTKGLREHTVSTRDSKDPTKDRTTKELYRGSTAVPEKHQPSTNTGIMEDSAETQLANDTEGDCCGDKGTPRTQKAIDLLGEYIDILPQIQGAVMSFYADGACGTPCECEAALPRLYRCKDCFFRKPVCRQCFTRQHRVNPLHRVEHWDQNSFKATSLRELGLVVCLMHEGGECPHTKDQSPLSLTVYHTNGVHEVAFKPCLCANSPSSTFLQLLVSRLLASSTLQPRLAFSTDVLKDFHLHNLVSKKSAFNYAKVIRRKTSARVSSVPDNYLQFIRTMRLWRLVVAQRRSGQWFNIDAFVKFRPPGSYILPCLACPIPGFNMPPNWKTTNVAESFIHFKSITMDGNLHLTRLKKNGKNSHAEEASLWKNYGFFPIDAPFHRRVLVNTQDDGEKQTCSSFAAVEKQERSKFKGQDVSGVFSVVDARHGLLEPSGTVDLHKGEAYADYALARVLEGPISDLATIILSYDVNCQWKKKAFTRFQTSEPHLAHLIEKLVPLIGKMHLQAHIEVCKFIYSLNLRFGTGTTDGEASERWWAELNQAAGSTKQMNPGQRHEVLNDMTNDWNWCKTDEQKTALSLSQKHAESGFIEAVESFDKLSAGLRLKVNGTKTVDEWTNNTSGTLTDEETGEEYNVYQPRAAELPTYESVRLQLHSDKLGHPRALPSHLNDVASTIEDGLRIQQTQFRTKQNELAEKCIDTTEREALTDRIETWREKQYTTFPQIASKVDTYLDNNDHDVVDEVLWLPSDFSVKERDEFLLGELLELETKYREAEAYSILEELRHQIKGIDLLKLDAINTFGTEKRTRARKRAISANDARNILISDYNRVRDIAIDICSTTTPIALDVLTVKDCFRRQTVDFLKLGSGSKKDGWLWHVGLGKSSKSENEIDDDDRVQWFRARAVRDRYKEEIAIVKEEHRRFVRSCVALNSAWLAIAQEPAHECNELPNIPTSAGTAAYAHRTASMFFQLGSEVAESFHLARGSWSENETQAVRDFVTRAIERSQRHPIPKSDKGKGRQE